MMKLYFNFFFLVLAFFWSQVVDQIWAQTKDLISADPDVNDDEYGYGSGLNIDGKEWLGLFDTNYLTTTFGYSPSDWAQPNPNSVFARRNRKFQGDGSGARTESSDDSIEHWSPIARLHFPYAKEPPGLCDAYKADAGIGDRRELYAGSRQQLSEWSERRWERRACEYQSRAAAIDAFDSELTREVEIEAEFHVDEECAR